MPAIDANHDRRALRSGVPSRFNASGCVGNRRIVEAHACKSLNPGCSGGRWASQHVSLPGSGTVNVARRNWSSRNRNSSVLRAFSSSSHSIQFSRYNSLRRHALHLRNVANLPSHNCQKPGVGLQLGSSPILARSTKFCTAVFDATCSFAAARVRV